MEVASIDEAYLDITQSQLLFKSPLHIAQSIKDRIRKKEQLTCSIGVAPNKLLAKLGSRPEETGWSGDHSKRGSGGDT